MKKIFSSQGGIFEAWAKSAGDPQSFKCKSWGQTNIFCEGPSIYSYGKHFELGRHVMLDKPYVLLNNGRYSLTTSNHQWGVNRATSLLNQIFVPNDSIMFDSIEEASSESLAIAEVWYEAIKELGEQLLNKRVQTAHRYCAQLETKKIQIESYYSAYKLDIPKKLTDVFDLLTDEGVMQRQKEQKEQADKITRCYRALSYLNIMARHDDIDYKILKIAYMGDAKVKLINRLPEDKIQELAVRCGFDPVNPYKSKYNRW